MAKTTAIGSICAMTTRPPGSLALTMLPGSTRRNPTRPESGAVMRVYESWTLMSFNWPWSALTAPSACRTVDTQAATVRQAEGAVKADQGQLELIKVQLSYTRITAPLSGRVGLRLVDPGNMVKANDPGGLVVIAQIEPIAVVFAIPEDSLQPVLRQYRTGKAVPVDAYDREGKKKLATGVLAAVDNPIDPATGTVKLKASFPNHDGALFPNQFVNARVLLDVLPNVVLAPGEAIQRGPQGAFVYVVKPDGSAQMRRLELGPSDGGLVAVKQGLAAGEAVVVDGAEKLQDGAKVEPRERAPARTRS